MQIYRAEIHSSYSGVVLFQEGQVFPYDVYTDTMPASSPIKGFRMNPIAGRYPYSEGGYTVHGLLGFNSDKLWFLHIDNDPGVVAAQLTMAHEFARTRTIEAPGSFFDNREGKIDISHDHLRRERFRIIMHDETRSYTARITPR